MEATEVQLIQVEGDRIDAVRNVERIWLEVEVLPSSGCVVEGRLLKGTARVEVYADRVRHVLARTRTDEHHRVHQMAQEHCEVMTKQWIAENQRAYNAIRNPEERAAWLDLRCNLRPQHYYPLFGHREGLPPLAACRVVHPQTDKTMDAREWQKLDATKRKEWLVDAPTTPMNAAARANEHLADTIAKAIERASQGNGKR